MMRYCKTAVVIVIAVAVMLLIGGLYCSVVSASFIGTPNTSMNAQRHYVLTTDELFNMLKSKDFLLVNVHVPYEGELPQTDLFIPYNEVDLRLDRLPSDKNSKIVLYCKTDRMSEIAAERLAELGYTNVWDVKGGMIDWREKGYPLLNASF